MKAPSISWYKQKGTAVHHNHITLTPESQVLHLKAPFGGFVWQYPTAVFVEQDGQAQTIAIEDKTRTAVWTIWGFALLIIMLARLRGRGSK